MHTPTDLLRQAADIIAERGETYGGIENNFQLIADLASLRLGRDIHPFEVAIIMVCVKNARAFNDPTHLDSRVDAMNYEAFAVIDDKLSRFGSTEPPQFSGNSALLSD
jgi:hypothetical protein